MYDAHSNESPSDLLVSSPDTSNTTTICDSPTYMYNHYVDMASGHGVSGSDMDRSLHTATEGGRYSSRRSHSRRDNGAFHSRLISQSLPLYLTPTPTHISSQSSTPHDDSLSHDYRARDQRLSPGVFESPSSSMGIDREAAPFRSHHSSPYQQTFHAEPMSVMEGPHPTSSMVSQPSRSFVTDTSGGPYMADSKFAQSCPIFLPPTIGIPQQYSETAVDSPFYHASQRSGPSHVSTISRGGHDYTASMVASDQPASFERQNPNYHIQVHASAFTPPASHQTVASTAQSSSSSSRTSKTCTNCGATSTPMWRRNPTTHEPLCNACGIYLQTRHKQRPPELINADTGDDSAGEEYQEGWTGPVCSHCLTRSTSVWRRSKEGAQLCNACGVYVRLRGKERPLSLRKNRVRPRVKHGE